MFFLRSLNLDFTLDGADLTQEPFFIVVQLLGDVGISTLDPGFDLEEHGQGRGLLNLPLLLELAQDVLGLHADSLVDQRRDRLASVVNGFSLQVLKLPHRFIRAQLHLPFPVLQVCELSLRFLLLPGELPLLLFDLLLVLLPLLDQKEVLFLKILENTHQIVCVFKRHLILII